jgi:coproporphyrinogen III oxidase
VVSRKGDMKRHAKRHAPDSEYVYVFVVFFGGGLDLTRFFLVIRKLPCPWEGCGFSTLQKSNLETHYRRQYVHFHQLNASFFKNIYLTLLPQYARQVGEHLLRRSRRMRFPNLRSSFSPPSPKTFTRVYSRIYC